MRISSGGGIMLPGIWGQKQTGWRHAHAQSARKIFSVPQIGPHQMPAQNQIESKPAIEAEVVESEAQKQ